MFVCDLTGVNGGYHAKTEKFNFPDESIWHLATATEWKMKVVEIRKAQSVE